MVDFPFVRLEMFSKYIVDVTPDSQALDIQGADQRGQNSVVALGNIYALPAILLDGLEVLPLVRGHFGHTLFRLVSVFFHAYAFYCVIKKYRNCALYRVPEYHSEKLRNDAPTHCLCSYTAIIRFYR